MRTKRHVSFVPEIGDKTSAGCARKSRQQRKKVLCRKRGCHKLLRDLGTYSQSSKQEKHKRKPSESCSDSSKEFIVDNDCARMTLDRYTENMNQHNFIEHRLSITTTSSLTNYDSFSCNLEAMENLNYEASTYDKMNTAQYSPQFQNLSHDPLLEHNLLSLDTSLCDGSQRIPPDNSLIDFQSGAEVLNDSETVSPSLHLQQYPGEDWRLDNLEQLTDCGGNVMSESKARSFVPPYILSDTQTDQLIQRKAIEQRKLPDSISLEGSWQLLEQSTQSNPMLKRSEEDIFEVIWQSLFVTSRKGTQVTSGEQQHSGTTRVPVNESFSPTLKLNFCPPFMRRLYFHH